MPIRVLKFTKCTKLYKNMEISSPSELKIVASYGDKQKVKGCYIMNDNYFDEFVLEVIINKKYLSEEQLDYFKQKPIEFEMKDPF